HLGDTEAFLGFTAGLGELCRLSARWAQASDDLTRLRLDLAILGDGVLGSGEASIGAGHDHFALKHGATARRGGVERLRVHVEARASGLEGLQLLDQVFEAAA